MNVPVVTETAVELLDRSVGYLLGVLPAVSADRLGAPTPCRRWAVQDLLDHTTDGVHAMTEAFRDGDVIIDRPRPDRSSVAHLRAAASTLLGELSTGSGRPPVAVGGCVVTAGLVASAGSLELTVHGWDLAMACGLRRPIPGRLAAELSELAPLLVTPAERPEQFAQPVPVPATSPPADRLLAFLGRTP